MLVIILNQVVKLHYDRWFRSDLKGHVIRISFHSSFYSFSSVIKGSNETNVEATYSKIQELIANRQKRSPSAPTHFVSIPMNTPNIRERFETFRVILCHDSAEFESVVRELSGLFVEWSPRAFWQWREHRTKIILFRCKVAFDFVRAHIVGWKGTQHRKLQIEWMPEKCDRVGYIRKYVGLPR